VFPGCLITCETFLKIFPNPIDKVISLGKFHLSGGGWRLILSGLISGVSSISGTVDDGVG
jgi:hypothetical protein